MKRLVLVTLGGFLVGGSVAWAQQPPATCEENVETLKIVYATSRSNAEIYLEQLALTKVRADQTKVKLDEALKKIKELEDAKLPAETKPQ